MRIVGLLGGTFDPVHNGHLRIGLEVMHAMSMEELRFIPCADPPHKTSTNADYAQRSAMLKSGIAGVEGFSLDDREFHRQGPSYTIDTLRSVRGELGNDVSICWIVGSDSFQTLDTWHEWEALFEFAHFVVACRPGWQRDAHSEMGKKLADRFVSDPFKLEQKQAGYIMPWQVTQLAISATEIRKKVKNGESPRFLVPDDVASFIELNGLYK